MQISTDLPLSTSINRSIQPSEFYEAAIAVDETIISNYWYLGVSYLLEGREDDAQAAWYVPLAAAGEQEIASCTNDLVIILEREAIDRSKKLELETSWLIRQHLWSIAPDLVENILELIIVANTLDLLTVDLLVEWDISNSIGTVTVGNINDNLLERAIIALSQKLRSTLSLEIIESCLSLSQSLQRSVIPDLIALSSRLFYQEKPSLFPVRLAEICQLFLPDELGIHQVLVTLYSAVDLHRQAIDTAQEYDRLVTSQFDKLFASYLIQRSYLKAGDWDDYQARLDRQRSIQLAIITEAKTDLSKLEYNNLIISSFFTPYIEDNPQINRPLQNQLAQIYQHNIDSIILSSDFKELPLIKKAGSLRIGYLASTLKEHSVGWLSRWLFHYHDRDSFQIVNYCIDQSSTNSFNHKWFRDKVDISYYLNTSAAEIAAQIKADKIDILIDLDSLTSALSCMVMAHKPAPVQVTWLGLDASGLPAIDYFIADPYVLPDDAQDYYQEKIWRLPQTYLGVEGFEIGIPNLRREDLDIPADAVVYLSSQVGYKRHPDCIKAQMKIIKAVPNSYFLIKGKSDPETIQNFFGKLAAEVGISLDRLRFLAQAPDEPTHRANLAIADIVLDTFPYNGATTTLETLWMGIPMVTQVGQQFAARNSYTFMLNAGIEEGIAWSQAEYIEWGIKLGLDRDLRDKIAGKLRSGRTTAPVWNAKQFTLDMEQAYREMWAKYQEQIANNPDLAGSEPIDKSELN
jgi:predicted O-linked N-acetylglucosamine transferase (SPINDLY family)